MLIDYVSEDYIHDNIEYFVKFINNNLVKDDGRVQTILPVIDSKLSDKDTIGKANPVDGIEPADSPVIIIQKIKYRLYAE